MLGKQRVDLELHWSFWLSFWRPPKIDVATGQIHAAGDAIILRVSLAELREAGPQTIGELATVH
jgi:hypothetical protein